MRNLSRLILFCSLIICCFNVIAQKDKRDSLWKIYANEKQLDTNRLNAIGLLIRTYLDNNLDSAILLGEKQAELARETKQDKYIANACMFMGYSYYQKENTTKALEYFLRALSIYQDLGDLVKLSKCYTYIGLNYFKQSNYPQTLDYYLKSLKIDEEAKNKTGMAMSYNNIGIVFDKQLDFPNALKYHFKALKLNQEIEKKIGVARSLQAIGTIYERQGKYDEALANFFKALKICEEEESEQDAALCYTSIGIIYFNKGNYSLALSYYNKALKINEALNDKKEICTTLLNIGSLYNTIKDFKLAEQSFNRARVVSFEMGDADNLRYSYEGLARVYEHTKDYKKAYENHVLFKEITDSIFNVENSKQLSDIKTNFEVGKIETELKAKAEAQQLISKEEKKRQQFIIYGVIAILIIVIVFSFFLYKRFRVTNHQKQIIEIKSKETEAQKAIIEEQQKETIDSINYAKRIQQSLLANSEPLAKHLPKHFILFNPKDIVSGDFYWTAEHNNKFYLAVCDSTGHGVPGAFMSLLNIGFLNEAIKEKDISQPHEVLNFVRKRLIETIGSDGRQDGMDAILICADLTPGRTISGQLSYSAANNAPLLIRNKEIIELSKDKMPVGRGEKDDSFSYYTLELQPGDNLYLYTDGFADQFGGPKGKKFKSRQLQELLLNHVDLPFDKQKETISTEFSNWKGSLEQVDDVCLIGIKI